MKKDLYKEARKDAMKYAKAKMNYGTGAGIQRRHVNAELEKKLSNEAYKDAFDYELAHLDYDKIIFDINAKNKSRDFYKAVKSGIKKTIAVGTAGIGLYSFYEANKGSINQMFVGLKNKSKSLLKTKKQKEYEEERKKAKAFLKMNGIDAY